MGGTMRLGEQPIDITEGTLAYNLYGEKKISERHRHRYEVNPQYIEQLEKQGLRFSGRAPDKIRMEIMELPDHPYFIASQYHPEFKSRPLSPAPLFFGLIKAALKKKGQQPLTTPYENTSSPQKMERTAQNQGQ
jgi:CTP synthase